MTYIGLYHPSREKSLPSSARLMLIGMGLPPSYHILMYAREEDSHLEKVRRILRLDLDIQRKLLYLCSRKSGGRAMNDRV